MKSVKECILITEPMFMGLFSGSDVWLIPIERRNPTRENADTIELVWEKAYVGDDWYIQNECCYGYKDEACAIAVEPEQMMWKTAPEYASQNNF